MGGSGTAAGSKLAGLGATLDAAGSTLATALGGTTSAAGTAVAVTLQQSKP